MKYQNPVFLSSYYIEDYQDDQKKIIVNRYKMYNEQHPRAGLNIQHVIYEQLARAGQNT